MFTFDIVFAVRVDFTDDLTLCAVCACAVVSCTSATILYLNYLHLLYLLLRFSKQI